MVLEDEIQAKEEQLNELKEKVEELRAKEQEVQGAIEDLNETGPSESEGAYDRFFKGEL